MQEENFLRGYIRLNQGTEIPEIFALWCGLSGVSTVLGRRLWLDMGTYQIFPNNYVVLVASSGRMRKSTAIGQIERLLRMLQPGPNIVAQKMTPEALIEAMRVIETDVAQAMIREKCEGVIIADELGTFLNRKSFEAGLSTLMIPLWDCKENFEYHTKGRGKEKVTNSCLSMLAGSTVDKIREAIPEEAVGEGLTSRILFVYCDTPNPPVPWTTFDEEKRRLLERLHHQLGQLQLLEGEVKLSVESREWYENKYREWYKTSRFYNMKTLSGYASRRFVHLLKIAMLFSVVDSPDKIIKIKHLQGAEGLLTQTEQNLPLVMNLITTNNLGSANEAVLAVIREAKQISRGDLLKILSHRIDARGLTEIVETLSQANLIYVAEAGGRPVYVAKA